MEMVLGRPLYSAENVHHLDGDRLNNSPTISSCGCAGSRTGSRTLDLLAWALEILDRYAATEVLDPGRWDPPPEDCRGGAVRTVVS
jgi:hypothetical protein